MYRIKDYDPAIFKACVFLRERHTLHGATVEEIEGEWWMEVQFREPGTSLLCWAFTRLLGLFRTKKIFVKIVFQSGDVAFGETSREGLRLLNTHAGCVEVER